MASVQAFQRKVKRSLEAVGIAPDKIESYGQLVSFKKRVSNDPDGSSRWYAWQILEALPDSEINDHFEAKGLDGKRYFVVRFVPGTLPKVKVTRPRKTRPAATKPAPASKPAPEEAPKTIAAKPAPAESCPKATGKEGNYLDKGQQPATGTIAWTTVPKKGNGALKQARCEITNIRANGEGMIVNIRLTKTGQELQVSLDNLFDHVPHATAEGIWR